jgi:hypothetical protein
VAAGEEQQRHEHERAGDQRCAPEYTLPRAASPADTHRATFRNEPTPQSYARLAQSAFQIRAAAKLH